MNRNMNEQATTGHAAPGEVGENTTTTPEAYRELYRKADTWGDLDRANDTLDLFQVRDLLNALALVQSYTGLDARQEFLKGSLQAIHDRNVDRTMKALERVREQAAQGVDQ